VNLGSVVSRPTSCGSGIVARAQLAQRFVALEVWPERSCPDDLWLWKCGQSAAVPTICGSGSVARAQLAQRFVALEVWPGRSWSNDLWFWKCGQVAAQDLDPRFVALICG
jgi:hypothetical protein